MELRENRKRERDLRWDISLWNPLFLQMFFAIKTIKDYFISLPPEEITIFDFGCGVKPYERFCINKKYIGIDIDKKNTEAEIHADVTNVPIEDNKADVVVSFYLLEHVENPQMVINEKYRILKDGGELFMLVPLYWEEHEQPYDFFRFTRYGIEMMMKKAGFKNILIQEVNSNPSILGMHLARFFNRKIIKILIPIINYIFQKLEYRAINKAKLEGKMLSNVMTFSVKGRK